MKKVFIHSSWFKFVEIMSWL